MRDIKFRAWDKDLKQMHICGQDVHDSMTFDENNIAQYYNLQNGCGSPTTYELMQYTGLKDKNGVKIYEGDIVKIHKHSYDYGLKQDEIGQIKFIDGAFGFYREKTKNEYYFNDLATENGYGELDYYEVIGNIYDNPELLEE